VDLREDLLHHPPVHVGEADVAALRPERQALVIDAERVEDRGVQIVNVHRIAGTVVEQISSVSPYASLPLRPPPASHA